jgi:hypothetical protein
MNIINAYIDWHKGGNQDPELVLTVDDDLPEDNDYGWTWERTHDSTSNSTVYYGQRSDGLVRFYWGSHFKTENPYTTNIVIEDEDIEIVDPAISRCPVINYMELGPCVNAKFVNGDEEEAELNQYTHVTLNKCIHLLNKFMPNVRITRRVNDETEEAHYIIGSLSDPLPEDETLIYPDNEE